MGFQGRLAGKTAIVTGGTQGIGASAARLFAREGARLVIVARRPEPGQRLIAEIGLQHAIFVAGDVGDATTAAGAVTAAIDTFGSVDVLVNNAGIDFTSPVLETEVEDVRRVLETNFIGALLFLQYAARSMLDRGGSIINVTSRTATVGIPTMGLYGASKGALLSLTRAAAVELASHDIRVNAVAPGVTKTPLIQNWIEDQEEPPAFERQLASAIPQRRIAMPEEIAAAILFLASDEASHVTGALIPVDGGYTAQ